MRTLFSPYFVSITHQMCQLISSVASTTLVVPAFITGKKYDLDKKMLSLSPDIINKVNAMRSKKEMEKVALTREEELEAQVSNLKKALEYSELRNQGLMKVIEICSKEYGEDLLKKAGSKQ